MRKLFLVLVLTLCLGIVVAYAEAPISYTFENDNNGTLFADSSLAKDFTETSGDGNPQNKVIEESGAKFMRISGISQIMSKNTITEPYTLSVDTRLTAEPTPNFMGIFIRAGVVFNAYEWDFYVEKGGTDGESSNGATGIIVTPISNGIRIRVKTQSDGPWGICSKYHDFTIDGVDFNNFTNVKIVDKDNTVSIYVKDALLATIEMSNQGEYSSDASTQIPEYLDHTYFKTVIIKDAQGDVVLSIDNARVLASDFYLGFAVRTVSFDIDNYSLSGVEEETEETTEEDTNPQTGEPVFNLGLVIVGIGLLTLLFKKKCGYMI